MRRAAFIANSIFNCSASLPMSCFVSWVLLWRLCGCWWLLAQRRVAPCALTTLGTAAAQTRCRCKKGPARHLGRLDGVWHCVAVGSQSSGSRTRTTPAATLAPPSGSARRARSRCEAPRTFGKAAFAAQVAVLLQALLMVLACGANSTKRLRACAPLHSCTGRALQPPNWPVPACQLGATRNGSVIDVRLQHGASKWQRRHGAARGASVSLLSRRHCASRARHAPLMACGCTPSDDLRLAHALPCLT